MFLLFLCFFYTGSWFGGLLIVEGVYNYYLFFLTVFIFFLIYCSEFSFIIVYISSLLVIFSFFFFYVGNFLCFYMFFELSIIPVLFLILGYGLQIEKISSSYYLIFYSMFSIFPFIYVFINTDYLMGLVYLEFIFSYEFLFLFSVGFLMKFPVYFLHFWLPKAHVEAPTSGSILLAGLLLKFGTMGFSRFLYSYGYLYSLFFIIISLLGVFLCCFICALQSDSKALVAYSSVVHMSFLFFIFLVMSSVSKNSSLYMMISHGYTSSVLFYIVGLFFHFLYSRMVYFMNSSFLSMFLLFSLMSIFLLFNSGLPPSLGFFSEFLGILSSVLFFKFSFFLFFVYYFFSFYYSLYFLINFSQGRSFFSVGLFFVFCLFSYFFYSLNIFFIFSF